MLLVERLSDARRNGHRVLAVVRGTRGQPGRRVERADRPERPVAAAGDPPGPRRRRGSPPPTWTWSRRTAPAPRSATRSRRRRCWPRTGRTGRGDRPLWLGSVKSNIGHTQAAAGVAGVIKMVHGDAARRRAGDAARGRAVPARRLVGRRGGAADRGAAVAGGGPAAPGGGVVVRHLRHQRARDHRAGRRAEAIEAPRPRDAGPGRLVGSAVAAVAGVGAVEAALARPGGPARRGTCASTAGLDAGWTWRWSLATTRAAFDHRAVVVGASVDDLLAGLDAAGAGCAGGDVGHRRRRRHGPRVRCSCSRVRVRSRRGWRRDWWAGVPVFDARLAECQRALAPYLDVDLVVGVDR